MISKSENIGKLKTRENGNALNRRITTALLLGQQGNKEPGKDQHNFLDFLGFYAEKGFRKRGELRERTREEQTKG